MVAQITPTSVVRQARVSIESKKHSWQDGFASAVRDEEYLVQYALDANSYYSGWKAGRAWLAERHLI
jgi:hypothetical protein